MKTLSRPAPTLNVARVTMKSLTPAPATNAPLMIPMSSPVTRPARTAITVEAPVMATNRVAAALSPMLDPIDRSMPPLIRTKVSPAASKTVEMDSTNVL